MPGKRMFPAEESKELEPELRKVVVSKVVFEILQNKQCDI